MKWWEPLELPLCSPCDSLLEICPYPSSSICYHLRMNWDRKIWFTPSQRKFYAITICFDSSKPRAKLIILDLWIIIRVLDAEAGAIDCVSGFQIHGWESYYQNNHILVEAEAEVEAVEAALNQLLPKRLIIMAWKWRCICRIRFPDQQLFMLFMLFMPCSWVLLTQVSILSRNGSYQWLRTISKYLGSAILWWSFWFIMVYLGPFWCTSWVTPPSLYDWFWLLSPFKCPFNPEMGHISDSKQIQNTFALPSYNDYLDQFWSILVHFGAPHGWPHHPSMTGSDSYPLSSVHLIQK